jgi:Fe-S-cluster containining protein
MRCSNCGICCTETEMLLSKRDIRRLEKSGFSENIFVKYDSQGYAQLNNQEGTCVFYDVEKRRCTVYSDRPSGCRVYPVILDEEKGIVLDDICDSRGTISGTERKIKGEKVIKLLDRIDKEAANRRS